MLGCLKTDASRDFELCGSLQTPSARCRGVSLQLDQNQSVALRLAVWTCTEHDFMSSMNRTHAGHWLKTTSTGRPRSQKCSWDLTVWLRCPTPDPVQGWQRSYLGVEAGRGPRLEGGTPRGPPLSAITTTATPSVAKVKESQKGKIEKLVIHFSINCFSHLLIYYVLADLTGTLTIWMSLIFHLDQLL